MFVPSYFEFQSACRLISGEYALENIPAEMRSIGSVRPVLLADRTLEKIGSVDILLKALEKNNFTPSFVFTDIPLDSSIRSVNEIASLYRSHNADGIIALGGGSVIDTAKGLRMLISQGGKDILSYAGCEVLPKGQSVPFVAIATTSGTGSETTSVAVIKDDERNVKLEFISPFLLPDVAVLDVRLLQTMPKHITAITALDALTHAIESFSCMQKNPISQSYAIAALRLINENVLCAIDNPSDKKARLALADAAFLAGAAFSNSMVGIVHAIGHSVGAVSKVPHGSAMTILLPACLRYNMKKAEKDYEELLLYMAPETYAELDENARADAFVCLVENLIGEIKKKTNIATRLAEAGVRRSDFPLIAERAINDGALIVNPENADKLDILKILDECF